MKKKVLIFTYYFPPAGGVAVQRFLKFSKYLPQFGWEPVIVTVADGSYPYMDDSLLRELPAELEVYRTKTFEPFEYYNWLRGKKGKALPVVSVGAGRNKSFFQRVAEFVRANLFIPDARKGWVPYAVAQAEQIIAAKNIEVLITTGPPHSTHLIGLRLKEKYPLKWIADFRDPWTEIFYNHLLPRTKATQRKDKALETAVLAKADKVTAISPGLKKMLVSDSKNCEVIYNGFDEDDFDFSSPPRKQTDTLLIRYVGNLMSSQNPENLWQVIRRLSDEGCPIALEFTGRVDSDVRHSINNAGLSALCSFAPFTEHRQAVRLMQEADLLLFVVPDVADNLLIVTGKLFEYLASASELISIGPLHGDAAEILRQTGRRPMLDFADAQGMEMQLRQSWEQLRQRVFVKYHAAQHKQFSRRNQTRQLADLLNRLTEGKEITK